MQASELCSARNKTMLAGEDVWTRPSQSQIRERPLDSVARGRVASSRREEMRGTCAPLMVCMDGRFSVDRIC